MDSKSLYSDMLLIRRFEERCAQLYTKGHIAGFCHLYNGQEAVAVGVRKVLSDNDSVITAYRDHGHLLACGVDPKIVLAELTGRCTGISKGKGGSMHMFSLSHNFYGGHGIVGAQVPIGAGIAFAHRYRKQPNICVSYLGDGAANQGQVYEAFNMSALWSLPIIYIIENNQYAMGTSVDRHAANTQLYRRGESFGIPGIEIDGMDIYEVMKAMEPVVNHVRSGKGPYLVEMKTYRYRGHSMSDPARYRQRKEVDEYRLSNDPLLNLEAAIFADNDPEKLTIEKDVSARVDEAVAFALDSPLPLEEELYTDIYVGDNA